MVQISSQERLCSEGLTFTSYEEIGERVFPLAFSAESQERGGSTHLPAVLKKEQVISGPWAVFFASIRKVLGYFPTPVVQAVNWESQRSPSKSHRTVNSSRPGASYSRRRMAQPFPARAPANAGGLEPASPSCSGGRAELAASGGQGPSQGLLQVWGSVKPLACPGCGKHKTWEQEPSWY